MPTRTLFAALLLWSCAPAPSARSIAESTDIMGTAQAGLADMQEGAGAQAGTGGSNAGSTTQPLGTNGLPRAGAAGLSQAGAGAGQAGNGAVPAGSCAASCTAPPPPQCLNST